MACMMFPLALVHLAQPALPICIELAPPASYGCHCFERTGPCLHTFRSASLQLSAARTAEIFDNINLTCSRLHNAHLGTHALSREAAPGQQKHKGALVRLNIKEHRHDLCRQPHHEHQLVHAPARVNIASRDDWYRAAGALKRVLHCSPCLSTHCKIMFVHKCEHSGLLERLSQERAKVFPVGTAMAQEHVICSAGLLPCCLPQCSAVIAKSQPQRPQECQAAKHCSQAHTSLSIVPLPFPRAINALLQLLLQKQEQMWGHAPMLYIHSMHPPTAHRKPGLGQYSWEGHRPAAGDYCQYLSCHPLCNLEDPGDTCR